MIKKSTGIFCCLLMLSQIGQAALAESGARLLERLQNGANVSLSDHAFSDFEMICLVGWDRGSLYPEEVTDVCGALEDHSLIGIGTVSGCRTIIDNSLQEKFKINFAEEGDVQCVELPSDQVLQIDDGLEGLTFDRLIIHPYPQQVD